MYTKIYTHLIFGLTLFDCSKFNLHTHTHTVFAAFHIVLFDITNFHLRTHAGPRCLPFVIHSNLIAATFI